ncbi:calcium-binding protein [Micromonospora sp. NPDC020750]|uniref:calcium-binding protein n=1 Tax=unclassified Micromonospora TaxID=2617518 RepID=UPI00378D0794
MEAELSEKLRRIALGAGMSLTVGVAHLLWAAAPAHASGGTVQVSGSTVSYVAPTGVANDVTAESVNGGVAVTDTGSPVVPGVGCVSVTSNRVTCQVGGAVTVAIWTGDLADEVHVTAAVMLARINLGAGDDLVDLQGVRGTAIYGMDGDDVVYGSEAGDTIDGGSGDDRLYGLGNADILLGGAGADLMSGGTGTDTVTYADHATSVSADADGVAGDDGAALEGDTIRADVEKIVGGGGADRLVGTGGSDVLVGGAGDDTLVGGGGDDLILGEAGADTVFGDQSPLVLGPVGRDVCELGPGGGTASGCEVVR